MKIHKNKLRIRRDMELAEELISDPFSNVPHSRIHKKRIKNQENKSNKSEIEVNESFEGLL